MKLAHARLCLLGWACSLVPSTGCGARSGLRTEQESEGGSASSSTTNASTSAGIEPVCLPDGESCSGTDQCCNACVSGVCEILLACAVGDPPVALVTDAHYDANSIQADGEFIYFHGPLGISRVPKMGGSEELVGGAATNPDAIVSFAVTPDAVFYSKIDGATGIRRIDKITGAETVLGVHGDEFPVPPSADVIAYASGLVVYQRSIEGGAKFGVIPASDGPATENIFVATPSGQGGVWPFVGTEGHFIYHMDTDFSLVRDALDGSSSTTLFAPSDGATPLAILDGKFFADTQGSNIAWVPSGGGAQTVIPNASASAASLTADGDTLYFDGIYLGQWGTYRVPSSNEPVLLAPMQLAQTEQIVVDASCAYYLELDAENHGTIFRIGK